MDYVKNTYNGYIFDTKLSQVFVNKPTNVDEKTIIKLRSDKHISDCDMELVKFLFDYRFATEDMLYRYIRTFKKTKEEFHKDLNRLIVNRVINAFALMDTSEVGGGVKVQIPADAYMVYCLDMGGRVLLCHFHNYDTTAWYSTENMRGPEKVGKDLVTNEFYLTLIEKSGFATNSDNYLKLNPTLQIGKERVVPSFEIRYAIENGFKSYIGDIVRRYEFPVEFRTHLTKLDSICVTNAWKKYFYNLEKPPVIFFICEDDAHALEVARMIVGTSSFEPTVGFRLLTDERIKKGLGSEGTFLQYDADKDQLITKTVKTFRI